MYFCYNLEKEEGLLKTELKNCLSLYKIFYSCAFILILCAIHPVSYTHLTIDVSCPIYSVLPEKIKKIFCERNRNICGQYVKFEPVGGNTIHFSYGLVLKNSKVQFIDMQQRISAL